MTTTLTIRSILSASAISALGAIALLAQTGNASAAKNVLSCDGTSRRSVIECCETLVRKNGLPMWMKREGKNCRSQSLVCVTKSSGITYNYSKKYCYYVRDDWNNNDKGNFDAGQKGGGKF